MMKPLGFPLGLKVGGAIISGLRMSVGWTMPGILVSVIKKTILT